MPFVTPKFRIINGKKYRIPTVYGLDRCQINVRIQDLNEQISKLDIKRKALIDARKMLDKDAKNQEMTDLLEEMFSPDWYFLTLNHHTFFLIMARNSSYNGFDWIAKMSVGSLLTILISVGGQYILNNNSKDECRLNSRKSLIYSDSFIGDIWICKWHLWGQILPP